MFVSGFRSVIGPLRFLARFGLMFGMAAALHVQAQVAAPKLLITEFMAANATGLQDEDGEYSDWIEIHNPNSTAVALKGWRLTDNPEALGKWQFPDVSIPAQGFLLVFASGKDRTNATAELHAGFA